MRFQTLVRSISSTAGGGALLIAAFSVISKLLGFLRDRLIAGHFGASRIADIYFASFRIPDLVFNILVLGALTSAFIPIFQKTWNSDRRAGIELSNSILNILLLVIGVLAALLVVLAPQVMPLIVPGFQPSEMALTVTMTRIMLVSLLFFTASNVLSGVLNAWHKFFTFAVSSAVYNVGIIFGIVLLYPIFGIYGLSFGVVLGSALHFGVQLAESLVRGWRYAPVIRISAAAKRIFVLMIPRAIGLAASQINQTIILILASALPAGHLAIFMYADNLRSFPIGIFGISLAVATFPSFSQTLAANDLTRFRTIFSRRFRQIIFFLIPISFTILLLRAHIVRVVLGSGSFDWNATLLTAQKLGYFAIAISAQGLIPLMARAFYAAEDTRTPVIISISGMCITIGLALFLVRYFGLIGLAIADASANLLMMLAFFIFLHAKLGDLNDHEIARAVRRILSIRLVSAAIVHFTLQATDVLLASRTFVGVLLHGTVAGSAGFITYLTLALLLNFDEAAVIRNFLRRAFRT